MDMWLSPFRYGNLDQGGLALQRHRAEDAAVVIVTEWQEFRSPDFEGIRAALRHTVIFDGRNLYDPALVERFGLRYFAIGRGESLVRS